MPDLNGDRSSCSIVAVFILTFALHLLFSPLVLLAIAVVAWVKFRPHRSHQ
jgi:hypothetical protein